VRIGRRRLLEVAGASAALAGVPYAAALAEGRSWRWRGTALGARASLVLVHEDGERARRIIARAVAELRRLEAVFSLYREDSALSRLNARGRLEAPPAELVELLSLARRHGALSGGAFDVTVQPLWDLYARSFAETGGPPADAAIAATRRLVDYRAIEVAAHEVRLARPGMAVTLNGIAQGYIADRVADLLEAEGVVDVLVDLGEIVGRGRNERGEPWPVRLEGSARTLGLDREAVATSSPRGTLFDEAGHHHHLFDPARGRSGEGPLQASVVAERAAVADALSTALAVRAFADPALMRRRFGATRAWLRWQDGSEVTV